ncbi:MAG: glycosyltransferase family 9 protein [Bacteroidota bacterium]
MNILIIQTAFIGDAILATSVLEKLHQFFPTAQIDLLVRKGNESLFVEHPFLNEVLVWDKKQNKLKNLLGLINKVRSKKYDKVINLHRFASSGIITAFSAATEKIGFDKNPLSLLFTKKIKHVIGDGRHEVERNQELIADFTDTKFNKPRLYPTANDYKKVEEYKTQPYVCMAPSSVWFTKQLPEQKWVELIKKTDSNTKIYLLGAANDTEKCDLIIKKSEAKNCVNLCGKLNLLQSAALIQNAEMNYVNDSAPLHLASATNANVTAFFCSTVPAFGFGPLSDKSIIKQTTENLDCRPCGLHGFKECPKGHFKCGNTIEI